MQSVPATGTPRFANGLQQELAGPDGNEFPAGRASFIVQARSRFVVHAVKDWLKRQLSNPQVVSLAPCSSGRV